MYVAWHACMAQSSNLNNRLGYYYFLSLWNGTKKKMTEFSFFVLVLLLLAVGEPQMAILFRCSPFSLSFP